VVVLGSLALSAISRLSNEEGVVEVEALHIITFVINLNFGREVKVVVVDIAEVARCFRRFIAALK